MGLQLWAVRPWTSRAGHGSKLLLFAWVLTREHSGAPVLAVLELLLGPDGLPCRFHVANRNDPGSACAGMLAEMLRTTADAVAYLLLKST